MKKENNLYNYSIPKSGNEETSFFLAKGRIATISLYLRIALSICIYAFSYIVYNYFGYYFDDILFGFIATLHLYLLPCLLVLFVLIQGAKRMHDINVTGWYFLIPFYNIYLSFGKGTVGSNDYGIDPRPITQVTYFDELEENEVVDNNEQINEPNKISLIGLAFIMVIIFGIYISKKNSNTESSDIIEVDTTWIDTPTFLKTSIDTVNYNNLFNDNLLTPDEILEFGYGSDTKLRQIDRYYKVLASEVQPVYFYSVPYPYGEGEEDAFFTTHEIVHANYESDQGFVYVEFTNSNGQASKGWLKVSDLTLVDNNSSK